MTQRNEFEDRLRQQASTSTTTSSTAAQETSSSGPAGRPEKQRFGFWKNLRLSRKLFAAFGLITVLALIVGGVSLWGLSRVQNAYEDSLAGGVKISNLSSQAAIALLEARRHEKDFLLRWKTEGFDTAYQNYVITNAEALKTFQESLKALASLASFVGQNASVTNYPQAQFEADLTILNQQVAVYDQDFNTAVQSLKQRGFVDTGLEGEFRTSIHNIENVIYGKAGLDNLTITMLQIRRNEKDYQLRGDQQYIDNVHQLVAQLKDQIAASAQLESPAKTDLTAQANAYLVKFDALVTKDRDAATAVEAFRTAAHTMEPLVTKISDLGNQLAGLSVDTARSSSSQNLVNTSVTVLIALLASVGLAISLARQITFPIGLLTNAAQQMALGNLEAKADIKTGDEIGTLAHAFNSMAARLRGLVGSLEQRVAARTRDLTLAAEVGRSISSVHELDILLGNAVELIRERFDLYYTQVYLTDATRRHLILRAGTGSVGRELMQRAHRLPINGNSINGTAAATQRVVIVADTANSDMFHPNSLLPDTRSEMAVPLVVGDRIVGVLDLQSAQPGALTDENLSAFEALAGQLAIAVENAALFAETEQARAEVEAQARRLTQAGWREFLDAVNRSERLGYTFDQQALAPLTEPLPVASNSDTLDVPIVVTGEPIGRIQLERDADTDRPWDTADANLVSVVAARVANQIENLRLLAQAEQYRAEAVAAMRRLTREGWESLQTQTDLAGYVYDLNEVKPVAEIDEGTSTGILKHSLVVRDEPIGELVVDVEATDEAAEIVAAVAEQLSGHIESLRLSVQMEQALATTQKQAQREQALRQITSAVRSSNDPATIMRAAVRELGNVLGRKTVIRMATAAPDGSALDSPEGASPISAVGGKE